MRPHYYSASLWFGPIGLRTAFSSTADLKLSEYPQIVCLPSLPQCPQLIQGVLIRHSTLLNLEKTMIPGDILQSSSSLLKDVVGFICTHPSIQLHFPNWCILSLLLILSPVFPYALGSINCSLLLYHHVFLSPIQLAQIFPAFMRANDFYLAKSSKFLLGYWEGKR